MLNKFSRYAKLQRDQRRLREQLKRSGAKSAAALAQVLEGCSAAVRCRSAACPLCGLEFQRMAVSVVSEFIEEPARVVRGRKFFLTVAPSSGCFALEDLSAEACVHVQDDILTALTSCGIPPAIGGFEVSFNEDDTGEVEPHWCAHAHLIGVDWLSDDQLKRLREAIPPSRLVKRPIKCEPLDGRPNGRGYPFKPERTRRVSYLETNDPNRGPYRTTKSRPLRPDQAVRLAVVDHALGFHGRLLTHAVDDNSVRRRLEGLGCPRDGPEGLL